MEDRFEIPGKIVTERWITGLLVVATYSAIKDSKFFHRRSILQIDLNISFYVPRRFKKLAGSFNKRDGDLIEQACERRNSGPTTKAKARKSEDAEGD